MTNCKSCNAVLAGNFCSNCGHPAKTKRIDGHYIMHEIEHVLHFEKGILYTIKELLIKPGASVKEFLAENRSRLVKPIIFIIITSLIYTLITHFFHIEEGYTNFSLDKNSAVTAISSWIQNHYGYANILMGIFIAFWLKVFFRKHDYNFFETLILLCFVMGMGMLIYAAVALAEGITKIKLMQVAGVLGTIYFTWALGQFYDKNKAGSYIKALIAYLLGMLTFSLLTFLTGFLIDLLKR